MILYVNGDSHSAGAEAVNTFAFAMDDPLYWALGRQPHPDNLRASYGCEVANMLYAVLHCDAESASSNNRIFRTTWDYLIGVQGLPKIAPDYVIIGWSTWEREEWLHEGTYYQVTASGTDQVPVELQSKYKQWVIDQSDPRVRTDKIKEVHNKIWILHKDLTDRKIPHVFFNTYSDFHMLKNFDVPERDWSGSYIGPYDPELTYYNWCINKGFKTVNPNSYHFGVDAHCAWAEFLHQHLAQMNLTQ